MPHTDQNGASSSDSLQGWKDIGSYLGRSVRAVQRWERELGLPVHRIKTTDGHTVYANRCEIDDWKKSRDLPKPHPEEEDDAPAASTPQDAAVAPLPASPVAAPPARSRPTWRAFWLTAVIALAIGLLAGPLLPKATRGPVTEIQVAGTTVTAFNSAGGVVWRTEMGEQVTEVDREGQLTPAYSSDGASRTPGSDVVVALRFGDPKASVQSDALVGFNTKGDVLWRVQPNPTLVCGAQTFHGPWVLATRLVVSQDPDRPRLWAAFNHNTHWPSLLVEIEEVDGKARQTNRYVQSGWIRGLSQWQTPAGRLLAINGTLNEFSRASTTLLSVDGPPSASPHTDPRFACEGTGTAMPAAVYLWPDLDVLGPEVNPMATAVKPLANGLQITLEQGGGGALVELGESGTVRSLTLPDHYWLRHRQRQAEGWIKHPAEACPEVDRALPIDTWTPTTGWTHSTIVSTNSTAPVRKATMRK